MEIIIGVLVIAGIVALGLSRRSKKKGGGRGGLSQGQDTQLK